MDYKYIDITLSKSIKLIKILISFNINLIYLKINYE